MTIALRAETDKPHISKRNYYLKRTWMLHLMMLPAVILALLFNYTPLAGIVIAFKNYKPWIGIIDSDWIGWTNFSLMFSLHDSKQVLLNTLLISILKIVFNLIVPIIFALLLNEIRQSYLKRSIQTLVYLPHFLSWVILAGILLDVLSIQGLVNKLVSFLGMEPIMFLGDGNWFRFVLVLSDLWKEFGFASIIFLAALSNINPALYEAAEIDGASRLKQTWYVTIPSIVPIMAVVLTLSLGNILNANFDQVYNLLNPLVASKGGIIDTYVYATFQQGNYSFATAVGLFKSVVGFVLISSGYFFAYKIANYRVF